MVQLRFGSLEAFDHVAMSYPKIGLVLNCRPKAVWDVVRRFLGNGYKVIDRRSLRKKKLVVSEDVVK